jgi:lipopolysaccharide transport system ATP-binding protein
VADIVLKAEGLGKRYRLGAEASLGQVFRNTAKRILGRPVPPPTDFWALSDVDFEIERGGVVGVIGRNGAGKSTLLKILSRITAPTTGRIRIEGRVSSLLEVGTGFHPDLTGRENIYMNGSILGMNRREIARKFDEIVAFAEIDGFLDTPIKRYSSGMYVRLAFAVSAHLEPDILVLDEVLAVGDAGFQRKCLGKMSEVAGHGRTVLFVSHNLPTVLALCGRSLYLEKGRLVASGPTTEIAALYQKRTAPVTVPEDFRTRQLYGNGKARFQDLRVYSRNDSGAECPYLVSGQDLWVETTLKANEPIADAVVSIYIYAPSGERVIDASLAMRNDHVSLAPGETAAVRFHLRNVLLNPDTYSIGIWIGRINVDDIDYHQCACNLVVESDPHAPQGVQRYPGYYLCRWTHEVLLDTRAANAA